MPSWKNVFKEARIGLTRNLLMTLAVVLSVAVSLTLFGAALLLSRQVDLVAGEWQGRIEVSIFLCDDARCPAVPDDEQQQLGEDLEADPVVAEVFFESKQEAFDRFIKQFEDQPALLETITPDALPASYRVKLADPDRFTEIATRFADRAGVEEVVDQREYLKGFLGMANAIRTGALWVAAIQLVAGAVLIANTVRVAVFSRREHVEVMKLVGASDWYVRLPFLLEGAAQGAAGAGVATGLLWLSYPYIREAIASQVSFVPVITRGEVGEVALVLLAVGVGSAVVAAVASLQRSLDI